MKIKERGITERLVEFRQIVPGQVYRSGRSYYLAIRYYDKGETKNLVSLVDGNRWTDDPKSCVEYFEPVDGEFVVA